MPKVKTPRVKSPKPTFSIRFVGKGVRPETVSLRQVNDALSAIQDLACGRDPYEQPAVPHERGIGLLDVKRGSAIYEMVARSPQEALFNLKHVGELLSQIVTAPAEMDADDLLISALSPLRTLSRVAASIEGTIEVLVGKEKLVSLTSSAYSTVRGAYVTSGDGTIVGTVERVGGVTGIKCVMRVEGRHKLLFCDVKNRKLARQLGECLYSQIVATGKATWISRTWRMVSFQIADFHQPTLGEHPQKIMQELREAGLDAWDGVDIEAALKELRS